MHEGFIYLLFALSRFALSSYILGFACIFHFGLGCSFFFKIVFRCSVNTVE